MIYLQNTAHPDETLAEKIDEVSTVLYYFVLDFLTRLGAPRSCDVELGEACQSMEQAIRTYRQGMHVL